MYCRLAAMFFAATAMLPAFADDEPKPEVMHCAKMAQALKGDSFDKFGVKLKRYRSVAGTIRVNLAYAGIDSDGAGHTGSFECRFRSSEVRNGHIEAATVFVDRGRMTKEAIAKYNGIAAAK